MMKILTFTLLVTAGLALANVMDSESMYTAHVQVSEGMPSFFKTPVRDTAGKFHAGSNSKLRRDGAVELPKDIKRTNDYLADVTESLETGDATEPELEKNAAFDRIPKQGQAYVEEPRELRDQKLSNGATKIFKDQMIVRVHAHPKSDKSINSVMNSLQTNAQVSEDDGLDVWAAGDGYVDIMVSQKEAQAMEASGHKVEMMIDDVQQLVDEGSSEENVHPLGKPLDLTKPPTKYLRLADLHKYYKDLAESDLIQTNATWIPSIGKSTEGRNIGAIRFGGKNSNKMVFFQAGIHAREWISPSTVLHVTHKLLTSKDKKIRNMVDNVEFLIVPSLNPDGYEYTHTTNRLWRKNRGLNDGGACKGVDLNRNWDDHWGKDGCSHNPCSETFAGSGAFSEPETKAARDLLLQVTKNEGKELKGAIDWHSYSQVVLRPYDWAKPYERKPKNEKQLTQLGQKMADIMTQVGGKRYSTEHASELYRVSGSSMAWQYAVPTKGGAAYTIELRDKGNHGFVLPANQIKPTATEAFPAVEHFVEQLIQDKFTAAYTSMEEDHLLTENVQSMDTLLNDLDHAAL
jgi:murein tripeptide amidase MpaA